MGKGFLVFILSVFLTFSTSWAEEKKEKETKLEEIVVTTSKIEKNQRIYLLV